VTKKVIVGMVLAFIVMMVTGVVLGLRLVLPVNPPQLYFPPTEERLGIIHWGIGYFQPVFLRAFMTDGEYFLKVAYRDVNNRIRVMDIYLGTGGALAPVKKSDGTWKTPYVLSDYQTEFKLGRRIIVSYFRNVIRRGDEEMYKATMSPDVGEAEGYCRENTRYCDLAKYSQEKAQAYWEFKLMGKLDRQVVLKALHVGVEPIK